MNGQVFSLDIGTRKVAGLLAFSRDGLVSVSDHRIVEHRSRAVRAGQIHDIEKTAAVVSEIKDGLEKSGGVKLTKAAAAIAGRNLRISRAWGETDLGSFREITAEDLGRTRLSAVQAALLEFREDTAGYYFAGHTLTGWRIDGEPVLNPLGHSARSLKAGVIATFLPRKVLESLFAVAKKTGLEISYLTLEPIAAVEAVLPSEMRGLPLVLVDIGAGTSDIAAVSGGSVDSFGMIPVAGDSITEFICGELLVDFAEGERIKKELASRTFSEGSSFSVPDLATALPYSDIFGRKYEKSAGELLEKVRPAVKNLAERISEEIFAGMPDGEAASGWRTEFAVVLAGGGSLTPCLQEELSVSLRLPRESSSIRPPALAGRFENLPRELAGPQGAVVLGLAGLALSSPEIAMVRVALNDSKLELLNFQGAEATVLSALISAGVSRRRIYGKPGLAKTFTLNGALKVIKGGFPKPTEALVNGEPSDLNRILKDGDRIAFTPALDGADAEGRIGDMFPEGPAAGICGFMLYNGEKRALPAEIFIDGRKASSGELITDLCRVEIRPGTALTAVLGTAGVDVEKLSVRGISVELEGTRVEKSAADFYLSLNGTRIESLPVLRSLEVKPGDSVEFRALTPSLKLGDLAAAPPPGRGVRIRVNGEAFDFPGGAGKVLVNGREAAPEEEVSDGAIIRLQPGRDAEAVLADVFRYISFEPKDTEGKRLKLLVNSREAGFATPLTEGAEVEVGFE